MSRKTDSPPPDDGIGHIGFGGMDVKHYSRLPVKLVNTIKIHTYDFSKERDVMDEEVSEFSPSLLEVLDAIYYEVTFYGICD